MTGKNPLEPETDRRPLPLLFSEKWLQARKAFIVYRKRTKARLRANPKCPVCGRFCVSRRVRTEIGPT